MHLLRPVEKNKYSTIQRNAVLAFIHEEASKVLNRWHLVQEPYNLDLPQKVIELLEKYPNLYLAGSALTKKEPADYDMYVVGNSCSIFDDVRKEYGYYETSICSFLQDGVDIQISKRFYSSREILVANFDLSVVRRLYRAGTRWSSILAVFEEATNCMLINMKNNSRNYHQRICKYRQVYNYFCVFETGKLASPHVKERSYDTYNMHLLKNIMTRKFHRIFISGCFRSLQEILDLAKQDHDCLALLRVNPIQPIVKIDDVYYEYDIANSYEIAECLLKKNYADYLKIACIQYVDKYIGPINPVPPIYKNHVPINVLDVWPGVLYVLKLDLPKYIRILIVWFLTLGEINSAVSTLNSTRLY